MSLDLKNKAYLFFRSLQKRYVFFRFFIWFQECGLVREIGYQLDKHSDFYLQEHPNDEMLQSIIFYSENFDRVNHVLNILADDKSREVYISLIEYRCFKTPIPTDYFSLGDQYFASEIVEINDNEVFLDGGAFIGDTAQHFIDRCKKDGKKYKRIVAFEPDDENSRILKRFFGNADNLTIIQAGLWDTPGEVEFLSDSVYSRIDEDDTRGGGDKLKCGYSRRMY